MILKKINSAKLALTYLLGFAIGLPLGYFITKLLDLWFF
jgi:hypothetical protein